LVVEEPHIFAEYENENGGSDLLQEGRQQAGEKRERRRF